MLLANLSKGSAGTPLINQPGHVIGSITALGRHCHSERDSPTALGKKNLLVYGQLKNSLKPVSIL